MLFISSDRSERLLFRASRSCIESTFGNPDPCGLFERFEYSAASSSCSGVKLPATNESVPLFVVPEDSSRFCRASYDEEFSSRPPLRPPVIESEPSDRALSMGELGFEGIPRSGGESCSSFRGKLVLGIFRSRFEGRFSRSLHSDPSELFSS